MKYWVFKANPEKYELEKRLSDPEPRTTWTVPRYRKEVQPDDVGFIWQTGPQGGIRATIRVDSLPQKMRELDNERKYSRMPLGVKIRVSASFLRRDLHLAAATLRSTIGLEGLSVFRMPARGTVYPVRTDEAAILLRLIE